MVLVTRTSAAHNQPCAQLNDIDKLLTNPPLLMTTLGAYNREIVQLKESGIFVSGASCPATYVGFYPAFNQQILGNIQDFVTPDPAIIHPHATPVLRALSAGLFTMQGDEHKQYRHLVAPLFNGNAVQDYFSEMVDVAEQFLNQLSTNKKMDLYSMMSDLCLAMTNKVLFGFDNEEGVIRLCEQHINQRRLQYKREKNEEYQTLSECLFSSLKAYACDINNNSENKSILANLARAYFHKHQQIIPAEVLAGFANTLFVAGKEPLVATLVWTILLLVKHPSYLKQLQQHLAEVQVTLEDVSSLSMLDDVINESMRLMPATAMLVRTSMKDISIDGVEMQQGSEIWISPFLTHRNEDIFVDALKFNPSRWRDINPSAYEFIAFGSGPRLCVGSKLALMQAKIILAVLLRRFSVSIEEEVTLDWKMNLTLQPVNPVAIVLQNRGIC